MTIVGLLAETHGEALRALAAAMQCDFNGLSVAARHARACGLITNKTAKHLEKVDIAFAVARHLTEVRAASFLGTLHSELHNGLVDGEKETRAAQPWAEQWM